MMVVADTHVWIWWAAKRSRLSRRALEALESHEEIGVSAISCWEFAVLVATGRLQIDRDPLIWVRQSLALPKIVLLDLSPEIAVRSVGLDEIPGDPADRIIVASALLHDAPLVTKDRRLRSYRGVRAVW